MVSTGIHCYIFLRILFCVAISVAENDRMLNAKWCIWGFILYGYKKKKHRNRLIYGAFLLLLNVSLTVIKLFLAEREGFEPPVPLSTAVFKTAVIDHSTTFPNSFGGGLPFKSDAKVLRLFESCKLSGIFLRKKYKNSIFAPEKAERKGQKQTFPCKKRKQSE